MGWRILPDNAGLTTGLLGLLLGFLAIFAVSPATGNTEADSGRSSAIEILGHWRQGGVLFGRVAPGSQVSLDGRSVRVSEQGRFVFGLSRDADRRATVRVVGPDGTAREQNFAVDQRDYNIQRIEGVASKHVTPPESVLSRIAQEAAKVREARRLDDAREDFLQDFQWPLQGPITGVYGSQRVYNGVPKSPHYGIDIAAPQGTPVKAPASGVVTLAEADLYYSGGTLIIDHGHGLSSTFIHLHKVLVSVGQRVEQGETVAQVGATGRSTGAHLDWRMNWFDVRVDPQLLMSDKPMPQTP